MKRIIGIIANTMGFNSLNPFDDKYYAQNNYVHRIKSIGGIPIIIPPVDLKANQEALDLCDAFIITGGKDIHQYHFDVIDYALKTGKKLLGICMGMQAIAMYSNNDLEEKTLEKIDNHFINNITHSNKEVLVHNVKFESNSLLSKIFGNELFTNSVHNYAVRKVSKPFRVVGKYKDVIEAIEYKNIIGVQFHPELMKNTDNLFKWLIN